MPNRTRRIAAGLALLSLSTLVVAAIPNAAGAAHKNARWQVLDSNPAVQSGTPTVWINGKHVATVLWLRKPNTSSTYETATLAASGKFSGKLTDAFSGAHWGGLSNEPTLLGVGGKPLVVFTGQRGSSGPYSLGCVYGAQGGSAPWTLQTWSLSSDCVNPVGSAGEGKNGTIAAAWPGGWSTGHGVLYRIGTSPTIPATGSDQHIKLGGGATGYKTGVAANTAGSGDFYVAWAQAFSNAKDGYYVKDVTAGSPPLKAPGTGTNSVNRLSLFGDLAIAARNTHSGVYLAYCSNSSTCELRLWRVGASTAKTVPSSKGAGNVAVSAGPSGRLWLAWYNSTTNKVSVVRTNKAATKFGRVHTYATPCFGGGLLGLSSGSYSRLDVALQCQAISTGRAEEYATQVRVSLHVALKPSTVRNTSRHQIVVTVTDAGDPVAAATVRLGTHHAKANNKGKATLTVAKGTSVGKHRVTASAPGYASGSAVLTVKH